MSGGSAANDGARRPWLVRGGLLLAALTLAWFVRAQLLEHDFRSEQETQLVKLLEEQPLEPLEIEEPPLELPEEEEVVELEEPDPGPDSAPQDMAPMDALGLDATGVAGGDAFGLLARRGGRDLLASGGDSCAWYETVLNAELGEYLLPLLNSRSGLRRDAYSVVLRLWLDADGRVDRYRVSSTGNTELDFEIDAALAEFEAVDTPPPADLPQPVRIRLSCRG